jgi:hypothetical protein
MSGDLTSIGPKLALLIPRLASTFDGEVVATVRAIDRTLQSAGRDFHDLAEAIARSPPPKAAMPDIDISDDEGWRIVTVFGSEADFTLEVFLAAACHHCGAHDGRVYRQGLHVRLDCACGRYRKYLPKMEVEQKLYEFRRHNVRDPP